MTDTQKTVTFNWLAGVLVTAMFALSGAMLAGQKERVDKIEERLYILNQQVVTKSNLEETEKRITSQIDLKLSVVASKLDLILENNNKSSKKK